MKFHYFISYIYTCNEGEIISTSTIDCDKCISSLADVSGVQNFVKKSLTEIEHIPNITDVKLLSWNLLQTEEVARRS